jgi:hypothetical protein
MDELEGKGLVDFFAEAHNGNLHNIRARIVAGLVIPNTVVQFIAGAGATGRPHEIFQQAQLAGAEFQAGTAAPRLVLEQIDGEICNTKNGGIERHTAPGESSYPGDQLIENKRLGKVVISPKIKTGYPILHLATSREQQHGSGTSLVAKLPQNLQAIAPRQHDIENKSVEEFVERQLESRIAIRGHDDIHAGPLESFLHGERDFEFVFDYKHTHHPEPELFKPSRQITRHARQLLTEL